VYSLSRVLISELRKIRLAQDFPERNYRIRRGVSAVPELVKKLPARYGPQTVITVLTRVRRLSL
jgi:hypothetical protein